jgi:hypothetical protein
MPCITPSTMSVLYFNKSPAYIHRVRVVVSYTDRCEWAKSTTVTSVRGNLKKWEAEAVTVRMYEEEKYKWGTEGV